MEHAREFYIDGSWVSPLSGETLAVINPATEEAIESIAMGGPDDVDLAVAAARAAFETYSLTTREERLALLDRIIEVYKGRMGELYGLSGYISGDGARARAMARRIRSGNVHLNGAPGDMNAPFGGYKQSGNGREWGRLGMEEFLETKAILGYGT